MPSRSRREYLALLATAAAGCAGQGRPAAESSPSHSPTAGTGAGAGTGTTGETTDGASWRLTVARADLSAVGADEPLVVFPPTFAEWVREAVGSDEPVRGTVHLGRASVPGFDDDGLAELSPAKLLTADRAGFHGETFALEVRTGPNYEYPFAAEQTSATEVPDGEAVIEVEELDAETRKPLVRIVREGRGELPGVSKAYQRVVEQGEYGQGTVAYLKYDGEYYELVRQGFTPTPTPVYYFVVSMEHTAKRPSHTLYLPELSKAAEEAFGEAFRAWQAGSGSYETEALPVDVVGLAERYDYLTVFGSAYRFAVEEANG